LHGNRLEVSMVFQGLGQAEAEAVWAPFREWIAARAEVEFEKPLGFIALPARHFWDAGYFAEHLPGVLAPDPRPDAPAHHAVWAGDRDQAGWFIHGYTSAWLPASLLQGGRQAQLVEALFQASRHWQVGLHFNKGLAGAPTAVLDAARDTATHPGVLAAFALAIIAGGGPPRFPGMPADAYDDAEAHANADRIARAMRALRTVAPGAGAYVSESDYFLPDWQSAFWGDNHRRLAGIKRRYDPEGLFFVRHGVGSEAWSDDGFTPLPPPPHGSWESAQTG
jgi:hypothetical protein